MADAGAGHFYFIERAVQISDLLTSELGEALEVVSRGVTVAAEAPAGVRVELLNPWPTREDRGVCGGARRPRIRPGDCRVQGHFARGRGGRRDHDGVPRRRSGQLDCCGLGCSGVGISAFDSANDGRQPRDLAVDEAVANIYAARARDLALEAKAGSKTTPRQDASSRPRLRRFWATQATGLHCWRLQLAFWRKFLLVEERMSAMSMKEMHSELYTRQCGRVTLKEGRGGPQSANGIATRVADYGLQTTDCGRTSDRSRL